MRCLLKSLKEQQATLLHRPLSSPIIILLLGLTLIRGGNFIAIKISLRGLTPFLAAGGRTLIGGIVLSAVMVALRRQLLKYSLAQIGAMVLMGGLLALNFGIVYAGLTKTTASRTAIIMNAQPLFVALLGRFFIRRNALSIRKASGLFISFLGVIIVFVDKESSYAFQTIRGDLMVLAASFVWAAMAIMRKRVAQKVEPSAVAAWEMWVSSLLILPAGLAIDGVDSIQLTPAVTIALLYCALLGSAFTFTANVYLLKNYDINAVSSFNFLIPVVGTFFGVLLLGEVFTVQLATGMALVALGIYLVNK